jgi:hypothetical protein
MIRQSRNIFLKMTRAIRVFCLSSLATLAVGCGGGSSGGAGNNNTPTPPPVTLNAPFQDASAARLPTGSLGGKCMDVDQGDVDGDGDIDLALAQENATNIVLLNSGSGVFALSAGAVGGGNGDNEDVRLRDFDGNGSLDMLTVHEDDGVHALLINDGAGSFSDMSSLIPVNSTANAAEVIDLNNDLRLDILLGNRGTNIVLIQQADGSFVDDTTNRPIGAATTQDLLLLDIDGDTDLDLFVANESGNKLYVNNGSNEFADETATRLPNLIQESREADAADIDNDGDMDIIVGNVTFQTNSSDANQLLLNDGAGVYSDATATGLGSVENTSSSYTIKFFDIDSDGDPDILTPRNRLNVGGGVDVWINDGFGIFSVPTESPFSMEPDGSLFDIEIIDANVDGKLDIYFCYRTGTDQLFLQQ